MNLNRFIHLDFVHRSDLFTSTVHRHTDLICIVPSNNNMFVFPESKFKKISLNENYTFNDYFIEPHALSYILKQKSNLDSCVIFFKIDLMNLILECYVTFNL